MIWLIAVTCIVIVLVIALAWYLIEHAGVL